ncbi:MAG: hypothetical protein ACU836_14090 [Gammaproteobacteria bacterium]
MAGQYVLAQRLINTPLSVIALSVQTVLLRSGNQLHTNIRKIITQVILLFFLASLLIIVLYLSIYTQTAFPFPEKWKLDTDLFIAAGFFIASSFSVGSVSIISIRLKDEWFVAWWQLIFLLLWGMVLFQFQSDLAFVYMMIAGGLGYWILAARWIAKSKILHG